MATKSKRTQNIFGWTFFIIVAVGLVFLSIIAYVTNTRFDMTEDQRFSIAQSTKDFLSDEKNFPNRLNFKIYLDDDLPAEIDNYRDAVEDKLKEFKRYAGDRIEFEFKATNSGTDEENRALQEGIYGKGRGIIPLDVLYQKDGSQTQMLVWPGATIDYEGTTTGVIQLLPGTKSGKPIPFNQLSNMIENSTRNLEYMLISAIRKATQTYKKRIGFLQGHGELTYQETQIARNVLAPFFNTKDIFLNDSLGALDGLDGLIIANPRQKFSNKDLFLIDQFVMKGGNLMCFMDALDLPVDSLATQGQSHTTRIETGLDNMLYDYGLKLNDNYVIDVNCAPIIVPYAKQSFVPWFFYVRSTATKHPISRNLEPVLLKYASEVQFVGDGSLVQSPILTSSTNSNVTGLAPLVSLGMPMNYGQNPKLVDNIDNEENKKCLAGLSEGNFKSYFDTRLEPTYANNPIAKILKKSIKEGKVLLVGNGRFLRNSYDSIMKRDSTGFLYRPKIASELVMDPESGKNGFQLYTGNQDFIQNVADYMLGESSVLDLRSKQIDIHKLDNEKIKENAGFYKTINMLLPCLIIVILALVFAVIRKYRYAQTKQIAKKPTKQVKN